MASGVMYAQEEEEEIEEEIKVEDSAEVFLENYSDAFQESFFEALKQKGIENYDKAIILLLECKRIDPNSVVVDHELAKAHLEDKQYVVAQDYAIASVNSEPENQWYLGTLLEILRKQGNTLEGVQASIPYENDKLKEHLSLIYYKQGNYQQAQKVLLGVKNIAFAQELGQKIADSIQHQERLKNQTTTQTVTVVNEGNGNPLDQYKTRIAGFIRNGNLGILGSLSEEALETYPSQPYFYYARGHFLNKKTKHKEAIEILEAALDYLIDDVSLANKIYKELGVSYTAIGNLAKANQYLSKVKPGF